MASERKTCKSATCHQKFSRPLGSRREYCETCRPPRKKPQAPVVLPGGSGEPGPIEAAAVAELEAVGRLGSVEGQLVVRLAREADRASVSGTQLSAVADRLLKAKEAALAGVAPPGDLVDELMERRRARRRA